MKKLMLLPVLLLFVHICEAQCHEELMLQASKTEYLNAAGVLERSVDESSTIEISKTKIIIKPGNAGSGDDRDDHFRHM